MIDSNFKIDMYSGFSFPQISLKWIYQHTPKFKGKFRLHELLSRFLEPWPKDGIVPISEKLSFCADFSQSNYRHFFLSGEYDPQVTWYLNKLIRPGCTFYDIGANFGLFTIIVANLIRGEGEIYAFEPLPDAYKYLERNVEINHLDIVHTNQTAVGDVNGTNKINRFRGLGIGHSSVSTLGRDDYESYEISLVSLDDYFKTGHKSIDVIKIDVEGFELKVLLGAERIIEKQKPAIILEINHMTSHEFDYQPDDLLDYLRGWGYNFYVYDVKNERPQMIQNVGLSLDGTDLLCLSRKDHIALIES